MIINSFNSNPYGNKQKQPGFSANKTNTVEEFAGGLTKEIFNNIDNYNKNLKLKNKKMNPVEAIKKFFSEKNR